MAQEKLISLNNLSTFKDNLGTAAVKDVPESGNASATQVVMGNDTRLSDARPASDVSSWAKAPTKPSYTASEVGLGNVTNDKQIKGLASGTTENHVVTFGSNGYTVKDSGFTIAKSVPSDAKFTDTTYSNATTAVAGLMSATDKSKLDGIAEGATANTGTVTSVGLTAGDGISVSGGPVTTSGSITVTNKGVRSVAQGTTNGTINVNTNGSTADVAVKGLGSLAYKSSLSKSDVGLGNVANLDQSKAIKSITRSGTTFTATAIDGTTSSFTQQDNNTTYSDATTATSGLMSASDKVKLNGVASGAEVNQNAFSNVKVGDTTVAADAKTDTLELVAGTNVTLTPDATNDKVTIAAKDTTYSANNGVGLSGTTFYNSGVRSIATGTTNGTINVNTNGSTANVAVKGLGSAAYTASTAYIASSLKGANNGVAELDSAGKVPTSQLPSFVDDVLEYDSMSGFPSTGEAGKIYVAKDTNKTYRWSGTAYVEISPSLALGETSSTAYRGDRGKTAYDHSQATGNPHGTTKANVGLGNVANLDQSKAIKSITRSGTTFTATALDGTTSSFTQQDSNTTYTGANGVSLSGTTFSNSGVRSIATGTSNGTINVNTNGSTANVAVKGLGAMAYKASVSKSDVGLGNVANLDQSKAIKSITRSGTTFTATAIDGTTSSFTQQDNNTTYTGANGISLSGTTFSNSGVRAVATGGSNGTINVNTNGTTSDIAVKGLGSAAYADKGTGVVEVVRGESCATTKSGFWSAMCNSGQTGSPTLPTSGKWWHVFNMDWSNDPKNWVSQLAVATQDGSGVWWRKNNASGTSIDSSTWHRLAEGDANGNANNANKVNNLTVKTAVPANAVFTDTKYSGANGVSLSGTTFSNSGVRSIAQGTSNGTINVNTNGSTADVAVKGLGAMAYKASVSKSDVGLGNVANLDQSKAIKSITRSGTTFTATAIDGTTSSFTQQDNNTTYSNVSTSAAGLAPKVTSTSAFLKGDGTWATPTNTTYSNVSTSAAGLAPKVTSTSKFLKGDGTWATPTNTWTAMVGATSAANGSVGYVNATPPKNGYNTKYLRADGTWTVPPNDNTTYSDATTATHGLMSTSDKTKLNGIATGAEVNQNAFSNVVVGSTTVAADSKTDTLTLAGSNVTLTPDATNDKVTIGITKANVTSALGYTPPTTNTTYTGANGVSLSGTTFSNSGVRSIATGGSNGTINVNTNGSTANVAVKGLGSAAYTASTAYATSSHNHDSTYLKLAGGTMTGALNFANGIANTVGDDVYMGDFNKSGCLGIQGKNGETGITLIKQGATLGTENVESCTMRYNSTNKCVDFVFV